jgi:hypothetical protein
MKQGSLFVLFCTYEIHHGMLQVTLLVSLENSSRGGVHGLGSMTFGLWTYNAKVPEYWMISSLKI